MQNNQPSIINNQLEGSSRLRKLKANLLIELSGLWRVFDILPFDICLILSLRPSEALNLGR